MVKPRVIYVNKKYFDNGLDCQVWNKSTKSRTGLIKKELYDKAIKALKEIYKCDYGTLIDIRLFTHEAMFITAKQVLSELGEIE